MKKVRGNQIQIKLLKNRDHRLSEPFDLKTINDSNFVIAYEPVWAIGTGKTATSDMIIDTHMLIRNILNDLISDAGYKTRVAANYNQALGEIDKKLPDVAGPF